MSRSRWFAARARNAARRGGRIALLGSVAVALTVLALTVLPNEVDRQVQLQIDALPPAPDTAVLLTELSLPLPVDTADTGHTNASAADPAPRADSAALSPTARDLFGDSVAAARQKYVDDTLATDLADRILRARLSPLPSSFQTLAESPLLHGDARVRSLADSIERVNQEREAHAALGGPGARYAALTTRLTGLGQDLVSVAEAILAGHRAATRALEGGSAAVREDRSHRDSMRQVRVDSIQLRHRVLTQQLELARLAHAERDSTVEALQQTTSSVRPLVAMIGASLVIGVVFGFLTVFGRELRRPTVSDAQEVERMTSAPVFVHASARQKRSQLTQRRPRYARIAGGPAPLIDRQSESFALVHLALTGVGDVVADVEVRSDEPIIEAAVALSVAAAAAKESRAALVVEATRRHAMLGTFLGVSRRDEIHELTLDRDERIDVVFADAIGGQFSAIARRYDLRLHVVNRGAADALTPLRDVVLCVRQGHSTLAWLTRATEHARKREQRIRAVVLWTRPLPVT